MLLAIDTATNQMSIALHDGQTLLCEQTWVTGNRHTTLIAPAIQTMLEICDVATADIQAVAVTTGPGSYTPLRIGVSLAKGIAATRNLPLIGIPTLDLHALATPTTTSKYRLIVAIQAGRSRIIAGVYHISKGRWKINREPEITTWEAFIPQLTEGTYHVSGEIFEKDREHILKHADATRELIIVDAVHRARRAGFLAEEAWRLLEAGSPADFAATHLAPTYLKSPG